MADENTLYFYYFIGRLNPPHNGHIAALQQICEAARTHNTCAVILLGSGAKNEPRTKNPIDFSLKKEFITSKLAELGFEPEVNFTIKDMSSGPFGPIAEQLNQMIDSRSAPPTMIECYLYVGGKEDDATKLNSVNGYVEKMAKKAVPDATVTARVVPVLAVPSGSGAPMSATQVREDAYQFFQSGEEGSESSFEPEFVPEFRAGFQRFYEKYGDFYGSKFAPKIYDDMVSQKLIEIEEEEQEQEENESKRLKTVRGGTRRKRKTRKTKKSRKTRRKRYKYSMRRKRKQ